MLKYIPTTIAVAGVLLLFASTCLTAYAQAVPGAVLYFNPVETDQGRNDKAWRNAGEAGGELGHTGDLPKLEEGVIEIKKIGFKENTKWYTAEKSGSTFSNAAPGNNTPIVNLEDFTMGLLVRGQRRLAGTGTPSHGTAGSSKRKRAKRANLVRRWGRGEISEC